MSKQIHYNIDNISQEKANFNLIWRGKVQWEKLSSETQKRNFTIFRKTRKRKSN